MSVPKLHPWTLTPKEAIKVQTQLRDQLVKMEIRQETYFFNTEGIDFDMYPTLFDLLIFSWNHPDPQVWIVLEFP